MYNTLLNPRHTDSQTRQLDHAEDSADAQARRENMSPLETDPICASTVVSDGSFGQESRRAGIKNIFMVANSNGEMSGSLKDLPRSSGLKDT